MNQNDWVEYFEAINGRKPSMQEFQEAREKGEFVVEPKDVCAPTTVTPAPTTEAQAATQEASVAPSAPLSQESTAFVPPHPVPRPKRSTLSFNKPKKSVLQSLLLLQQSLLFGSFSLQEDQV